MSVLRIPVHALVVALSAALVSGCSPQNPVAPVTSGDSYALTLSLEAGPLGQGAFFPLAVGNRWHAVADDRFVTIFSDGPPTVEISIHTEITREMTGTETISGREYTLLREDHVSTSPANPGGSTYTTWVRYRQDSGGLYESDVSGPPASGAVGAAASIPTRAFPSPIRARLSAVQSAAYERAWEKLQRKVAMARRAIADPLRAEGVAEGEITRLDYPLHPGASWTVREDPLFTSSVEGVERLETPAGAFTAYRIRIGGEFFGPEDAIHLWTSRWGQLRFRYRLVEAATDENGEVIGEMISNHEEIVDAISLVRR